MSIPPDPKSDNDFVFHANGSPPPQKKTHPQEDNNLLHDLAEEVADPIVERVGLGGCGCLWRFVTIPIRLILWVIDEVF